MKQHFKTRLAVIFMVLSIMLLCFGLVACGGDKTYQVTLDYNSEQGSVELSPQADDNKYKEGTEITVTVTPAANFELDTLTLNSEQAPTPDNEGKFVFKVQEDTTVKVTFKSTLPKFAVTVPTTVEHGEIDVSPAASDGKYTQGTEITVTLKPAQDYEVDTFTVGGEDKKAELDNNVYKFNITAETAITATFKPITKWYSITKNTPEHGTIDITPAAGESGKYAENTQITVTLSPETSYEVDTFTVDGDDKKAELEDNVYTFNITAETAIAATFKKTEIPATTITGVPSSVSLEVGEYNPTKKTTKLNPVVEPAESTDAVSYINDSPKTVEVAQDGTLTAVAIGSATIIVKAGSVQVVCAVEVTNHVHDYAYTKSTDGAQHHAACKTCEYEEDQNCKISLTPDETSADGHHSLCTECLWEGKSTDHTLVATKVGADNLYHKKVCDCGYSMDERHTLTNGDNADEHWRECSVCKWETEHTKHTKTYVLTADGSKHQAQCTELIQQGSSARCTWKGEEESHTNVATPVQKPDGVDPDHHYTTCSVCKLYYNAQTHNGDGEVVPDSVKPGGVTGHYMYCTCGAISDVTNSHTPGDNGKCTACGADCGTHKHDPIPDENGYYDGHCSCGENVFFTVDSTGKLSLTEEGISAQYKKILIPTQIGAQSVSDIGQVLRNNTNIESVIIPESITTLNTNELSGCSGLKNIVLLAKCSNIPNGFIGNCGSLEWIVISDSITNIASSALGTSSSATAPHAIYYLGTDWSSVTVGSTAQGKLASTKVYVYSPEDQKDNGWHWEVDKVTPKPWKEE